MCGIAGFIDPSLCETEARSRLEAMLALIMHRGPDGSGMHFQPGLALGMRRLSIIDLDGGAQPIWNEDRTIGVVFNGEIYNYRELTAALTAAGHTFSTRTDTEVLVHLYEDHGVDLVEKLRGMFAFALIDTRKERLFVARDHFGQKPLYYAREGARFAFASELKCLLSLTWVRSERDPETFLDYVSWLSLPAPRTHFACIHKLVAGASLTLSLGEPARAEPQRYWRYRLDSVPDLIALEPAAETLEAALYESVRLHLQADVPVGVLLSGGLDSRLVTAYAQELQNGSVQTFTVGFASADSELASAAETAREIRSQHHALELGPVDLAKTIERVAWHLDEPIGDPAAFAVLQICELARNHVKVLLSGEGADELFAGYDQRYLGLLATLARSDKLRRFAPLLPAPDPAAPASRARRLFGRAHHTRGSEIAALRIEGLPGDVRHPRGLTAAQLRRLRLRMTELGEQLHRTERDTLSELLVFDLNWQLPESLLQKADKMSMAASIELRTPILDREVAFLAARVPSSLKLPPGGPGKLLLRHSLSRKLHEPMRRPKKGFPVPLSEWFRGPLREQIEDTLFSSQSICLQELDARLLRAAWNDFLDGTWDGALVLYSLWLYEAWHRTLPR